MADLFWPLLEICVGFFFLGFLFGRLVSGDYK